MIVFFSHRRYGNVVNAVASGAIDGVKIIVGVVANIIVWLAALEFFNATIAWFGARVLLPDLSFEVLNSPINEFQILAIYKYCLNFGARFLHY